MIWGVLGNLLVNIAPNRLGSIDYRLQERLLKLGMWLTMNGEAIYRSIPWTTQKDPLSEGVWYTQRPKLNSVYAIFLKWPKNNTLILESNPLLFKPKRTHVFLLNRIYIPLLVCKATYLLESKLFREYYRESVAFT